MKLMTRVMCGILFLLNVGMAQDNAGSSEKKLVLAVLPMDAVKIVTMFKNETSKQDMALFSDAASIEAFADNATQKVVTSLLKLKRIKVVERSALDRIVKEQSFQMSDFAAENPDARIGELLGADYLLLGQLQQISVSLVIPTDHEKATFGKTDGFSGLAEFSLRLISVSSSEVTASNSFKGNTGFLTFATPTEAANQALALTNEQIDKWLKNAFPIEGRILEIQKEKKGDALVVAITCGSKMGVHKGDKFKVIEMTTIEVDGKTMQRSKDVGKLEVTKLEADGSFSKCEVLKGGKDIASKMKAGVRLQVVSTKK